MRKDNLYIMFIHIFRILYWDKWMFPKNRGEFICDERYSKF